MTSVLVIGLLIPTTSYIYTSEELYVVDMHCTVGTGLINKRHVINIGSSLDEPYLFVGVRTEDLHLRSTWKYKVSFGGTKRENSLCLPTESSRTPSTFSHSDSDSPAAPEPKAP